MPLAGMYRVSDGHVQVNQVFRRAALEGLGRAANDYQGEAVFGDTTRVAVERGERAPG